MMAFFLFKVVTESGMVESEGSAVDMPSMIDMLKNDFGKEEIQLLYVEEAPPRDMGGIILC